MKSVCFSGRKLSRLWVPAIKPFPQKPPEPTAILDWMVWYPVFRVCRKHPYDIHDIGDHGRGSGLGTRAGTIVERRPYGIAHHQHGIHDPVHVGDESTVGNHGRVDPQLHALRGAARDTQVLDSVSQLLGIAHVLPGDAGDALDIDPVKLERDPEGDGGGSTATETPAQNSEG